MKIIILLFTTFLLLIVQNSILRPLHLFPINLLLIFMAVVTLLSDFDTGLLVAVLSGFFLDLIAGQTMGVQTVVMLIIFLILHFGFDYFVTKETNFVILFASVGVVTILYLLGQILFARSFSWTNSLFLIIFNLIFTYPIFKIYSWIHFRSKIEA